MRRESLLACVQRFPNHTFVHVVTVLTGAVVTVEVPRQYKGNAIDPSDHYSVLHWLEDRHGLRCEKILEIPIEL